MTRLFLSYSRTDEAFARRIATDLGAMGVDVWLDTDDIEAGIKWSSAIQQGLDSADIMIVLITPASMSSQNVEDEWQYFRDQKKPIVPVLLQPSRIHFQLSRIQYVDFHKQPYHVAFKHLRAELTRKGVKFGEPPKDDDDTVELASGTISRAIPPVPPSMMQEPSTVGKARGVVLAGVALAIVLLSFAGIALAITARNAAISNAGTPTLESDSTAVEGEPTIVDEDKLAALKQKYTDYGDFVEYLDHLHEVDWTSLDYQKTVEILAYIYLNLGGWPEVESFIVDSGLERMLAVPAYHIGVLVAREKYSGDVEKALATSVEFGLINDNHESVIEFTLNTPDDSFSEKLRNYSWISINWISDDQLTVNITIDFDGFMENYSSASEMLNVLAEIGNHETVANWRII